MMMKNAIPWFKAMVASTACMRGDADGCPLVVRDRQDHRHQQRRGDAEQIKRPIAGGRKLIEQKHGDQQSRDRDRAGVVFDHPRLISGNVEAQHHRHDERNAEHSHSGFPAGVMKAPIHIPCAPREADPSPVG